MPKRKDKRKLERSIQANLSAKKADMPLPMGVCIALITGDVHHDPVAENLLRHVESAIHSKTGYSALVTGRLLSCALWMNPQAADAAREVVREIAATNQMVHVYEREEYK